MDNYCSDRKYITNSGLSLLLRNDNLFTEYMNSNYVPPTTPDMIFGNVCHGKLFEKLSGGSYKDNYPVVIVDDYNGRTKAGKTYYETKVLPLVQSGKNIITQSQYKLADDLIDKLFHDEALFAYFMGLSEKYTLSFEEVFKGEYAGILVKGKMDIVCRDASGMVCKIVDYKTTGELTGFGYSVRKYGYDRQSAMYSHLVNLNLLNDVFDFIAQDKKTGGVRIYKTNRPEFVQQATEALRYAIHKYIKWMNGEKLDLRTWTL